MEKVTGSITQVTIVIQAIVPVNAKFFEIIKGYMAHNLVGKYIILVGQSSNYFNCVIN